MVDEFGRFVHVELAAEHDQPGGQPFQGVGLAGKPAAARVERRVGRVRDPLGNVWWIQTRIEEVSPEEMERRLGDPVFIEAMRYVQDADFFGPG